MHRLGNDGSPAWETPPANQHDRSDIAADIATMLERQMVVYSSHRVSGLAARMNMPLNDVKALEIITAFETVSTGQLAHMLGVSAGGATLINRLETAGHVNRQHHVVDRRIIIIRPTSGGRQQLSSISTLARRHAEEAASAYDLNQLEIVQTFLSHCASQLKDDAVRWLESGQHAYATP
jgi:DNA-binding MarR family transcriptional regulator